MQTPDEPKKDSHQFLLDEAKRRFDSWRAGGGGRGSPIPVELWEIATNLLKYCSPSDVSRTLRLDLSRLVYKSKHGPDAVVGHAVQATRKPRSTPKLKATNMPRMARVVVEQPTPESPVVKPASDMAVTPLIEIDTPSGVRLRIYSLTGFAMSDIVKCIVAFQGGGYP